MIIKDLSTLNLESLFIQKKKKKKSRLSLLILTINVSVVKVWNNDP